MSVTAAASGLVVFLLSAPVIQGQNDYGVTYTSTEICALKGSTVDIGCSYTYPSKVEKKSTKVKKKIWFTKGSNDKPVNLTTDRDYTGRVEYLFHDDSCNVQIKDLRESDSAEYKFRFITNQEGGKLTGLPGVTLSVTDLQVQVEGSSTEAELKCHSRCDIADHTSYVWYNNGEEMDEETSSHRVSVSDNGNYSCAVKGHEDHRSPPVYSPTVPSASVSPSAEIVEGSSVTLTCSSDANPAATYTWYKENVNLRSLSEEPQLVLWSIQSSHSGQYYCTAVNKLGSRTSGYVFINVKYAPKLPSVSASPSNVVEEGSSVTLTCSSDANPAAKYTWYKENGHLRPLSEEQQLVLWPIQSSDSGRYYCRAQNELGTTEYESISINVKYAPKSLTASVSPSAEVVEGSSVTLTCLSDANPAATYTWYKKNRNSGLLPSKQTRNVQSFWNQLKLVFRSIQSSDSGEYYCTAQNDVGTTTSESISINVKYAPKPPSVSVSPSPDVEEGSSVTLTCRSDANPAAKYTWRKKNGHLRPLSEEPQLVFSSIQSSDSGQYYCTAENELGKASEDITINVKYAPKPPSVSVSPSGEIVEGSSVTLTCSSDVNPAANYTWYKESKNPGLLTSKQTQNVQPSRSQSKLIFRSIQFSDSGQYYCTAANTLRRTTSSFIFIDVKLSVSVSPSAEIVEGSSVNLTCSSEANPAANYTWYKENKNVPQGSDRVYHFISISSEDRGTYYCTSENQHGWMKSSLRFIDVQYAPKLPSVSVSPSAEIVEGSSVTLTCSSDANPAANYTWYKENEDSPKASGQIFTITDFTAEHSGNYYCEAQSTRGRHNSTLHLTVVADKSTMIMNIIRLTVVVVMLITLLLFCLSVRKKKTLSSTTEPNEPKETLESDSAYENVSDTAAQREDAEEQEDLV